MVTKREELLREMFHLQESRTAPGLVFYGHNPGEMDMEKCDEFVKHFDFVEK